MSSILEIMASSYYDQQTGAWKEYAPKTLAEAVKTKDGSNVQVKLDAIPDQITTARTEVVSEIRADVATEGNTLAKLHAKITTLKELVDADDVDLDTLQEVVDYIKINRDNLTLMGTNKVGYDDIINNLTTVVSVEGKVLDARQGKVLKDLIDDLAVGITNLQASAQNFVTEMQLNNSLDAAIGSAMPVISETAPNNPVDGQIWMRPVGSIEV